MSSLIHYRTCPVCGSADIHLRLSAKDHTVSGETFSILHCNNCTLRFTQDVPDSGAIGPYYKSEAYISHTNTSAGLINRLYQSVRKRTLASKRKLVEKSTGMRTGNLLDMGSGTGAFVHEMSQSGWNVTGLEPDAGARETGLSTFNVKLEDTDRFYELEAGSFDAITMWHVLEHVHDLNGYVAQLRDLLKPDGRLFIAVPNYTSPDARVYKEHWAAWDVPRHLYHFSPQSMQRLMDKHGLQILQHKPMWYDSFYVSMLSSKYKNGKTSLAGAFWNGLRSNLAAVGNYTRCSSVIYVVGR